MMIPIKRWWLTTLVLLPVMDAAATTDAIAPDTPWRVFFVRRQAHPGHKKVPPTYTPAPPAAWTRPDFDDSGWGRYSSDLADAVGGYGHEQSSLSTVLMLRTRFGVTDPGQARDLSLTVEYRGGMVIYINGQELVREHLPPGPLEMKPLADAYSDDTFFDAEEKMLRRMKRPATKNRERYEKRIREVAVKVPGAMLRKGTNVIALQVHGTPTGRMNLKSREAWSTVGVCGVTLSSTTGAGIHSYAEALKQVTVWNVSPLETVTERPGKYKSGFLWWGIAITPKGLSRANVFDPLKPIRTAAPRGGTCSGQVVVSGPEPMSGVKATISALQHVTGGARLPSESVQVRYAKQESHESFFNALMRDPQDGHAVQPIWVLIDVPRSQAPGWYTGVLSVAAAGTTTEVPVQVFVAGWTVPDPKDNVSLVSMYQSPETLAEYYKVDPWSDRHFELIEKSMRSVAKIGNDVLLVPVIIDNYLHHKNGLVRWVKKGNGYEPELSAFERYLDLHVKVFGTPKVVQLSIWKHAFGCRTWFRGMKSDTVEPCMVTEFDPATNKMKPMQAPHFGEPGSEDFWKTMIDRVRDHITARGCDEKALLLGEAFDSRPLQPVVDFFKKIAPDARWQIYSHWCRESPVEDGKMIALGGLETGFRINPNSGGLPEFDRKWPDVPARRFLYASAHRVDFHWDSSPLSYRAAMRSGTLARIGLDFWPVFEHRGRPSSYYRSPPNEGWLWRGHVPAITAPDPGGAVITTRGQMLLECVQEVELLAAFIRAKQTASPGIAKRIEACQAARHQARLVAGGLSQAAISMDWPGMAAREYALAAEMAGTPGDGDWDTPPATGDAR